MPTMQHSRQELPYQVLFCQLQRDNLIVLLLHTYFALSKSEKNESIFPDHWIYSSSSGGTDWQLTVCFFLNFVFPNTDEFSPRW